MAISDAVDRATRAVDAACRTIDEFCGVDPPELRLIPGGGDRIEPYDREAEAKLPLLEQIHRLRIRAAALADEGAPRRRPSLTLVGGGAKR